MKRVIRFNCPHCHQPIDAPLSDAGRSLNCPACARPIGVPSFADQPSEPGSPFSASSPIMPEGLAPTAPVGKRRITLPFVLAAIGGLAMLAYFGVIITFLVLASRPRNWSQVDILAAETQLSSLATQVQIYRLDTGAFPSSQHGLMALLNCPPDLANPDDWDGPYVDEIPLDPWEQGYQYELVNENRFRVFSSGPDLLPGTDDDVSHDCASH